MTGPYYGLNLWSDPATRSGHNDSEEDLDDMTHQANGSMEFTLDCSGFLWESNKTDLQRSSGISPLS